MTSLKSIIISLEGNTDNSLNNHDLFQVASINMFNPSPEVIAARDHIMHVVYSFLQPSRVWDR